MNTEWGSTCTQSSLTVRRTPTGAGTWGLTNTQIFVDNPKWPQSPDQSHKTALECESRSGEGWKMCWNGRITAPNCKMRWNCGITAPNSTSHKCSFESKSRSNSVDLNHSNDLNVILTKKMYSFQRTFLMHLCSDWVATSGTCCVYFIKRSMFYSDVGANVHSNGVSDVRWRLVCRMSGAATLTGAGQWPRRRGGMEGETSTRCERRWRDEGEQTCWKSLLLYATRSL